LIEKFVLFEGLSLAFGVPAPTFAGLVSHQMGTPFVPQTGPALLHAGEAVIPSWENPAAGGTPGSVSSSVSNNTFGGGDFHVHIDGAVDARSFAAMLMDNQSALSIAIKDMMRRNTSLFASATQMSR
jgi:hypothetical protein